MNDLKTKPAEIFFGRFFTPTIDIHKEGISIKGLTYLASPYTHFDPKIQEARYRINLEIAQLLIQEGWAVFSPLVHGHNFDIKSIPQSMLNELMLVRPILSFDELWTEFWRRQDEPILTAASRLIVLRLPGWENSQGIAWEMQVAKKFNIPIYMADVDKEACRGLA